MTNFQRERVALGQRLRELRQDAQLTGRQLAASCGWHPSKVSRLEAGKQTASEGDVAAWANTCGRPDEAPSLTAPLRSYESHYVENHRIFRFGMSARQRNYANIESTTPEFRLFQHACIPGLLQTAEYIRHRLLSIISYTETYNDVEKAVSARLDRQQALYRPKHKFHFVITEGALRLRLCPVDVLRGQLDRLISVTKAPNVLLGVIPTDAEHPACPLHGFVIFDDRIVRAETFVADLEFTQPHEVKLYLRVFADLAKIAVYGARARSIITRVADELATQPIS